MTRKDLCYEYLWHFVHASTQKVCKLAWVWAWWVDHKINKRIVNLNWVLSFILCIPTSQDIQNLFMYNKLKHWHNSAVWCSAYTIVSGWGSLTKVLLLIIWLKIWQTIHSPTQIVQWRGHIKGYVIIYWNWQENMTMQHLHHPP